MTSPVEPVHASPPPTGLLASAQRVRDTGWERGLSWRPERCVAYQGWTPCADTEWPTNNPDYGPQYNLPVGYRVYDECTLLGQPLDTERLIRQTDAVADSVIADELWLGTLTQQDDGLVGGSPHTNAYLADGNALEVPSSAATVLEMLGDLEAAALATSNGQQVFLHVPVKYILPIGFSLRRVGQVLYTPLDSVIVADSAYDGSGPLDAGTSEVQTVTLGGATGGTFTLTYSGQTTAAIAYNADAATVQAALNALSNLDGVTVSGSAGGPYTVTFPATLGNVAQMTGDASALTPAPPASSIAIATTTPGVAPAPQAGSWAYATGPVQVRMSDPEVIDDMAATVDRRTNRRRVFASRLFAVTFDPCTHLAVQLAS